MVTVPPQPSVATTALSLAAGTSLAHETVAFAAGISATIGAGDAVAVGATAGGNHVRIVTDGDRPTATVGRQDHAVIGCRHVAGARNRRVRRNAADDRSGLVVDRDGLGLAA